MGPLVGHIIPDWGMRQEVICPLTCLFYVLKGFMCLLFLSIYVCFYPLHSDSELHSDFKLYSDSNLRNTKKKFERVNTIQLSFFCFSHLQFTYVFSQWRCQDLGLRDSEFRTFEFLFWMCIMLSYWSLNVTKF